MAQQAHFSLLMHLATKAKPVQVMTITLVCLDLGVVCAHSNHCDST